MRHKGARRTQQQALRECIGAGSKRPLKLWPMVAQAAPVRDTLNAKRAVFHRLSESIRRERGAAHHGGCERCMHVAFCP